MEKCVCALQDTIPPSDNNNTANYFYKSDSALKSGNWNKSDPQRTWTAGL